jgi:hypothetical protein
MDWMWALLVAVRGLSPAPDDRWATTLTELDRVRAEAFATGDASRLDDVYLPDSHARRADGATIDAYAGRGGRVVGAELQILSCRVVHSTPDSARLEVVDQLGPARVTWSDGTSIELPRDRPSRRVVLVERTEEGWRISGSSLQ